MAFNVSGASAPPFKLLPQNERVENPSSLPPIVALQLMPVTANVAIAEEHPLLAETETFPFVLVKLIEAVLVVNASCCA